MRLVFFGTPSFAVPTLARLAAEPRFEVVAVVSQPDRPAGRGRRLEISPVAAAARDLDLPLYQPATLRDAASRQPLAELAADLFVVAAFGLIFGPKLLALPRLGCVNLHASLLPKYRGASPIAAAIAAGDATTGVTLMQMATGLDTGPMLATVDEAIAADDTTESLTARLAVAAADLAVASLPRLAAGDLPPCPQTPTCASLTRPLTKADGWLDWTRPAAVLERHVRAMWPWPRAWTTFDGGATLQVHRASLVEEDVPAAAGQRLAAAGSLVVGCGDGALRLDAVQPAGGRPMAGDAFAAGRRNLTAGFGTEAAPPAQPPLVISL